MKRIDSTHTLANFIREVRKSKGINQHDIGSSIGLRQATISKIENGSDGVKLGTLFRVLSALGYDMYLQNKNSTKEEFNEKWTGEW